MNTLIDSVVSEYIQSYRGLIEAEALEDQSVLLSFPFHYSANHRIELSVTRTAQGRFVISDMAKTVEELQDGGFQLGSSAKQRIQDVAATWGISVSESHLLLESEEKNLGESIQKFVEAAKTIADIYLVYTARGLSREAELVKEVKHVLGLRKIIYKEKEKVRGKIEVHPVNFLVPPNGTSGMAISILSGKDTHITAEAWGFKVEDIKVVNPELRVGLIYDVVLSKWSDQSRRILEAKADWAVPGNALSEFDKQLASAGIGKHGS